MKTRRQTAISPAARPHPLWRALARAGLAALLVASLLLSIPPLRAIAADPTLRPFIDRGADELRAVTDRAMAAEATPDRLAALIETRLAEDPRNWLVLDALMAVVAERALPLPGDLAARVAAAREADTGFLATAASCLACTISLEDCPLTQLLLCNAPVTLSPAGDVIGLGRQGWNYATGAEVDDLDLALSALGLGATSVALLTGGSSVTVKLGASTLRLARKAGVMTTGLTRILTRSASEAVDLAALRRAGSLDDLGAAFRPAALAPVTDLFASLSRLNRSLGPTETLHLLRHVDDPAEAARLARTAEALGPQTLGRIEVLGKTRLLRLGLRLSDLALQLWSGLAGLLVALTGMAGGAAQSAGLRLLRLLLRRA